jgi:cell wall-associated NlpC family hydrolase
MKNFKKLLLTGTFTAVTLFAMSITANAATTIKVTADTLNIRKGPSIDTQVVAMLSKGVECEVIGEEGNWYQIKYQDYKGYVSKEYVEITSQTSNNKESNNSEEEENTQQENNNEQNNQENNSELQNQEQKENTQENNNTQTEEKNNEEQNNKEETEAPKIIYQKFTKNTDVKILPLIHSSKIGTMKKNQEVILITQTGNWSYIQSNTISGWVRSDSLKNNTTSTEDNGTEKTETQKKGYVSEDLVNMRKGAGTNYSIIKVLALNTQVTILGEDGDWYQIKSGNDTGYISKEYISESKTTTSRSSTTSRIPEKDAEKDTEEDKQKTENNRSNASTDKKETVTTKPNKENNKETSTGNTNHTSIKGTDIIAYAKKFLGYPYVYGGDGSNGTFDCSGYTMYVFNHFGIGLPHGATSQYKSGKGTKITKQSNLQEGDIVFLTDYETGVGIGHCGIYIGNGNFIHASTTTYTVTISSLNTMYAGRFYAGLRLI